MGEYLDCFEVVTSDLAIQGNVPSPRRPRERYNAVSDSKNRDPHPLNASAVYLRSRTDLLHSRRTVRKEAGKKNNLRGILQGETGPVWR